ncbi:MAG: phosphate ABC transporter permease subunit PstC [Candidatus Dormibacteria bacterium]
MQSAPAIRVAHLREPRGDWFPLASGIAAAAAPASLLIMALLLLQGGWISVTRFGLAFVVGSAWNPVTLNFGALPFIFGTVVSSALALLLAVPVGLGAAIFLAEPGMPRLRGAVGIGVELLAAIPSVVYGIWGLYVLGPFLYASVEVPLSTRFPWFPLFAGQARQTSLFTASVVLAVMVLPTLAAVCRDVVRAVPWSLRESSYALGTTWWETTRLLVLPAARSGIFGAVTLALGRALGETIAVTMVIGNRPEIPQSLFAPAYTLASVIANEFAEATGPVYPSTLMELGLILMVVTLAVNVLATTLVRATARSGK